MSRTKIARSSGNVFEDLGLEDADELLTKAGLAYEIARTIESHKWTQAQAAAHLGVDQPKVSKLIRGRLDDFSVERLMGFLRDLGNDIEIRIRPVRSRAGRLVLRKSRKDSRSRTAREALRG